MGTYAITGAATGIGAAIKLSLESLGHRVIVVDIKDAEVTADLSTVDGRDLAIAAIQNLASDGLNGFIACAGLAASVPNSPLIARVNYFGAVDLVEGVRELLAKQQGSVVLISSNSAPQDSDQNFIELLLAGDEKAACVAASSLASQPVYSGSKQALARWMRRNVSSYAAEGIRLNAVAPGYTQTPMTAAVEQDPNYGEATKQFLASIPLARPGQPKDIAEAVCFLLSPAASFICGSVLFVDGGHDAMLRPDSF